MKHMSLTGRNSSRISGVVHLFMIMVGLTRYVWCSSVMSNPTPLMKVVLSTMWPVNYLPVCNCKGRDLCEWPVKSLHYSITSKMNNPYIVKPWWTICDAQI